MEGLIVIVAAALSACVAFYMGKQSERARANAEIERFKHAWMQAINDRRVQALFGFAVATVFQTQDFQAALERINNPLNLESNPAPSRRRAQPQESQA